jgi:hypothetical protein
MVHAGRNASHWGAYVAAGLAALLASSASTQDRPKPAPSHQEQAAQSDDAAQSAAPRANALVAVAEADKQTSGEDRGASKQRAEQPSADPIRITDWIMAAAGAASAIFAGVLALFTWRLIVVGRNQHRSLMRSNVSARRAAVAARDAAGAALQANTLNQEALIATQRPWVQVINLRAEDGLTWDTDWKGVLPSLCEIQNTGNSPAIGIVFRLVKLMHMRGKAENITVYYTRYCESVRSNYQNLGEGFALFPNERFIIPWNLVLEEKDFKAVMKGADESGFDEKNREVRIHVLGCVTYRTAFDDKLRQTGFIYEVRRLMVGKARRDGGFPLAIGVDLPRAELTYYRSELPVTAD